MYQRDTVVIQRKTIYAQVVRKYLTTHLKISLFKSRVFYKSEINFHVQLNYILNKTIQDLRNIFIPKIES